MTRIETDLSRAVDRVLPVGPLDADKAAAVAFSPPATRAELFAALLAEARQIRASAAGTMLMAKQARDFGWIEQTDWALLRAFSDGVQQYADRMRNVLQAAQEDGNG